MSLSEINRWMEHLHAGTLSKPNDLDPLFVATNLNAMYDAMCKHMPEEIALALVGATLANAGTLRASLYQDESPEEFTDWLTLVHKETARLGVPVPPKGLEGLTKILLDSKEAQ